jgi:hypothetical protein
VVSVPLMVEIAASVPAELSTALEISSALVSSWSASVSSELFACCPASVSGAPRPLMSLANVFVACVASSAALSSPSFVGLSWTELAAD